MGAAIARRAAAEGAQVAVGGRDVAKLTGVAESLGKMALPVQVLDLGDAAAVERAVSASAPFDHIVMTAADLVSKPFTQLSDDDIGRMIASKVWGGINIGRAAAKHLTATGSLTFFSGAAAYRPAKGASIVGAVNMFLEGLMRSLALELGPRRVNVVSPGVTDTPTWSGLTDAQRAGMFDAVARSLPVGRIGSADDMASAALALMTNGFITATVLHVDGGVRIG